ncbi:MAG: hypothetical protein HY259_00065 [Chloroflexi bacterium]|nr:hypothetical protein [Chloroflexota bacterium]
MSRNNCQVNRLIYSLTLHKPEIYFVAQGPIFPVDAEDNSLAVDPLEPLTDDRYIITRPHLDDMNVTVSARMVNAMVQQRGNNANGFLGLTQKLG